MIRHLIKDQKQQRLQRTQARKTDPAHTGYGKHPSLLPVQGKASVVVELLSDHAGLLSSTET